MSALTVPTADTHTLALLHPYTHTHTLSGCTPSMSTAIPTSPSSCFCTVGDFVIQTLLFLLLYCRWCVIAQTHTLTHIVDSVTHVDTHVAQTLLNEHLPASNSLLHLLLCWQTTHACMNKHDNTYTLTRVNDRIVRAVLQLFLSPLLLWHSFLANTLSVALYATAMAYYHYMNFLGYSALPFLEHTEVRGHSFCRCFLISC